MGNGVATAFIKAQVVYLFDSAKKIAKYIGACPSYQQSGTSIKTRGVITRHGDPDFTRYFTLLPDQQSALIPLVRNCTSD
jgi:transposase